MKKNALITSLRSVAWAAELKEVMSAFFFMLTLLAYGRYVVKGGPGRYALVCALFALGIMSKPMLVTLPFILLLLDIWPLRRVRVGTPEQRSLPAESANLVLEKI